MSPLIPPIWITATIILQSKLASDAQLLQVNNFHISLKHHNSIIRPALVQLHHGGAINNMPNIRKCEDGLRERAAGGILLAIALKVYICVIVPPLA
jgi:hypothetical protein